MNTKHFSRNGRLHDQSAVDVSAKRSLRLDEEKPLDLTPNKKATKTSQVKSSAKAGKGKNAAPAAPSTSRDGASTSEVPSPYNFTTAAQRKATIVKKNQHDTSKKYDTSVAEQDWYNKSGPSNRKVKEEGKKKSVQETQKELTDIMLDRNKAMYKMSEGIERWRQESAVSTSSNVPVQPETPEMMWAKSLVPHMMGMTEDTRDDFMVHVLSIAVKAKKGKWTM